MFNAISSQFKFQSPQIGNSKTKQSFSSHAINNLNYQIKDSVSFGNNKEIPEELKTTAEREEESRAKADYDPNRTALEGVINIKKPARKVIPTEKVIQAMEKAGISLQFDTNLEKILDANNATPKINSTLNPLLNSDNSKINYNISRAATYTNYKPSTYLLPTTDDVDAKPNPSINILKEVEKAGGNIDEINEEIQNNITPYLYKGDYNEKEDRMVNLGRTDIIPVASRFPGGQKPAALAQMIAESKTAKENPAPWVAILNHLINDPAVHNNDAFVIEQAAEALCQIGNSVEALKVFTDFKEIKNNINSNPHLMGIITAGENMIKARMAESAE